MTDLERKFNDDMFSIYKRADKELGYRAKRFLQMLYEKGGIMSAVTLVSKPGGTEGFAVLWEHKRLDLSVEALVMKEEYRSLFTDELREQCRKRLIEYGYSVQS